MRSLRSSTWGLAVLGVCLCAADPAPGQLSGRMGLNLAEPHASALAPTPRRVRVGTVTGRVTRQTNGQPVAGVSVGIAELRLGSTTGPDGRYTISQVPAGRHTLEIRGPGYETVRRSVTVSDNGVATLDLALREEALGLEGIVVTGTAGQARRREVGNSIATVNVSEDVAPAPNVDNLLAGRTPGVNINLSGGMAGSGAQIRLRGNSSAAMSNTPLIYVDGVRMRGDAYRSTAGSNVAASPLNDINPNDIERVEIIKGAAATTLYGTEAASGVIQIFTKRGAAGTPRIEFQSDVSGSRLQKFGPENEPYMRLDPWMRTGIQQRYSGSISGGSGDMRYFVSGALDDNSGVLPKDSERRYNVRGNFNFNPYESLQLQWNTAYTTSDISNPPGGNNGNGLLLNAYRRPNNFVGSNDPAVISKVLDWEVHSEINHLITGGSATYQPIENLTNRVTVGFDRAENDLRQWRPYGFFLAPQGLLGTRNWTSSTLTAEYVGSYDWQITPEFRSNFSLGGQSVTTEVNSVSGDAERLAAPGEPTLSAGGTRTSGEDRLRVINAGFFLQNLFDFKSRYFLTLGLRVDGNSAFGENLGLQPYPKASASYVISDEPFWNESWGEVKLRAAYGHAGRAPGAFDAVRTWNPVGWGGNSAFFPGSVGNPDLGPERTREYELGFDGSFLQRRLNVDFTHYHQLTTDALMRVRQVPSMGFLGSQLKNVGTIRNKGVELAVNTTPLELDDFGWDVGFSVATNFNKVIDLGEATPFEIGARSLVAEGGWVPGVYGRRLLNPNEIAEPVFEKADGGRYVFGPNLPTHTYNVRSELRLPAGISLSGRAEYQGGNFIHVDVDRNLAVRGVLPECNDIYPLIRTAERATLTARERARCDVRIAEGTYSLFVYAADFLKLRDLTLAVPVPSSVVGSHETALSLSLQNLRLWVHDDFVAWDPEMMQNGPGGAVRQIVEDLPAPYRVTASLRVRL
ncbi:MAG: TonB-dependent receptor [Gemmatimonadetes bacterium]|nr:TonB-dependent receptor [Gemmatimonadota bacterium]